MKRFKVMSARVAAILCGLMLGSSFARAQDNQHPRPLRPIHTYSIVARDPATGELGVAVQSHWFSVRSLVPWAESGTGAVATQSFVDPAYGKLGLDLMRAGRARLTLKSLLAGDENRDVRQVAMIDAQGRVLAHRERKTSLPPGTSPVKLCGAG
ncbi:MAG: DUF1028 domain-containing protein [Pyrinomonadaceae bacterium]